MSLFYYFNMSAWEKIRTEGYDMELCKLERKNKVKQNNNPEFTHKRNEYI